MLPGLTWGGMRGAHALFPLVLYLGMLTSSSALQLPLEQPTARGMDQLFLPLTSEAPPANPVTPPGDQANLLLPIPSQSAGPPSNLWTDLLTFGPLLPVT